MIIRNREKILSNNYTKESQDRCNGGLLAAEGDFSKIMSMLERDPSTNKIVEKIQIYTHSRGGGFGAGYIDALLKLIKKNARQFTDPNNVIDYVLNLAPHQSNFISAPNGINSFSIDDTWDMLSRNDMGE